MHFFAITLIILLAAISPGPDFAIVVRNTLAYSRKAGLMTALGVTMGILIHCTYCILGLGLVISRSLLAFTVIKYIGALYLIYLGIKGLLSKKPSHLKQTHHHLHGIALSQAFRQGFFTNLLNPKGIMFLLAFFTLILDPKTPILSQIAYSFTVGVIHLGWFSLLSILLSHPYLKASLNKFQYVINKVFGALLIGFGLRIAFLHHSA